MGWLDGDVDLGNYDWGGSDGYQSVLDTGGGGYTVPDTSWAYGGGEDWTPTYTNYGDTNRNDIDYTAPSGGGSTSFSLPSGGGGITSLAGGSGGGTPTSSLLGANQGYSLGASNGITGAAAAGAAPEKSITDKALGLLKDKSGDYDVGKILKLVTAVGGLVQAKNKQDKPAGMQSAQQLQQQLVQKNNDWTPQQSQWANNFLNTAINPNRGTVQAGAGGIKSIMPSRGYAGGGGIGAVGDTRYGNVPARALPEVPAESIWDAFRRKNEVEAGLRDPVVTLQEGNTPRISSEMYSPAEIMQAIMQLMGGGREEKAEGGSIDHETASILASLKDSQAAESGAVPLLSMLAELSAAKHLPSRLAQIGGGQQMADGGPLSGGTFGLIQGNGDGQSDTVPIDASPGEYMFDAETVSMLGNGSNEAGAQMLDQWRQQLREQKRGAPLDEIAPQSDHPDEYLPGEQ